MGRTIAGVALALAALAGGHDSVRAQTVADSAGTTLSPLYSLTRASVDGLAAWTRTAAGDLGGDPGETIEIAPSLNTVTIAGKTDVCDRTEQVRNAIVGAVSGVNDCADVTDAHLAAITVLVLSSSSITALAAGDFAGLISLEQLLLQHNQLTSLPDGVFAGLTSLEQLYLNDNRLTSLPDTVFAGLTSGVTLSVSPDSVGEVDGETTLTVTATLNGSALAADTAVALSVRGLTAGATDFTADTATLTISSGETSGTANLTLTPVDDLAVEEGGETVAVEGTVSGLTVTPDTLTITDDAAVCDRTTQVRDGIVAAVAGVTDCGDVTDGHLAGITGLDLASDSITTLAAGDFAGLTSLETLGMDANQLTSLPDGVFAGLTSLETLDLGNNQLSALPNSVVAGLTFLETLDLGSNRLSALPDGVFAGLTFLETLDLGNNQLTSLPDGVFAGLASLETLGLSGNTTDPLLLAVTLEKVGESGFKAVAPTGAPFEFVLPVSAANGSIEGDSIRIPAGAVESMSLGVTRAAGTTAPVTVDIDSLPGLPSNHSGYALRKSESLPLEVVPGVLTTGVTLSVSPDQVGEGAGATTLTVTATLNGGTFTADTAVALSVSALTADTTNFTATTATLTISSGVRPARWT